MPTRRMRKRVLPLYEAGAIPLSRTISGFDELIEDDTLWPDHSHASHELTWNQRGASTVTVGARSWTLTPALGLWVPAGVVHAAWTPAGTWYRAAHFAAREVTPLSTEPVAVEITPLLRLLLARLREDSLPEFSRQATETLVLDVLAPASWGVIVQRPESATLREIAEHVLRDPARPGSLAYWAERLGLNARTLTRAFQAETGLGYGRWVATVRMQRAAQLLVQGADSEDIAAQVGFSSVSAFGAAFRRVVGRTPASFREDARG